MQLDLEEDKTTSGHDYKRPKVHKQKEAHWQRADYAEFEKPEKCPTHFEDHENFDRIPETEYVPFNLFWKLKSIIQEDPRQITTDVEVPEDKFDRGARPRLVMSPGVNLDESRKVLACDCGDQDILTRYTFMTTWQKASQEAALPVPKRCIPKTTLETSADPVRYENEETNSIPLGWKLLSSGWDKVQNRKLCDTTRAFWERNAMRVQCGACHENVKARNLVEPEMKQLVQKLIKEDELHLSRDYPTPGYMGFMPKLPVGVPLVKRHYTSTNPCLSTSQAAAIWKDELRREEMATGSI